MKKPFNTFDWGEKEIQIGIDLSESKFNIMRPTELHHKSNGSIKDEPTFAIVMATEVEKRVAVGEISLEMLSEAFEEIGYTLKCKEK